MKKTWRSGTRAVSQDKRSEVEAVKMERIDNFEESKPVKVGIPRANLPNSVPPHQDGRVRIMHQIAGKIREFRSCDKDHTR